MGYVYVDNSNLDLSRIYSASLRAYSATKAIKT